GVPRYLRTADRCARPARPGRGLLLHAAHRRAAGAERAIDGGAQAEGGPAAASPDDREGQAPVTAEQPAEKEPSELDRALEALLTGRVRVKVDPATGQIVSVDGEKSSLTDGQERPTIA